MSLYIVSSRKKYNVHWVNTDKPPANERFSYKGIYDERNQAFYQSKEWRRISHWKLRHDSICEQCLKKEPAAITPAECVDHKVGLNDDWTKRFDIDNLQSLCLSCHLKKENEERKRKRLELQQVIIEETMNELNDFE